MRQRGDTIVEVLLAFAIFSMVSVGCMVVMGQGTNASQRALEITLVRQQLDAQAEALRAAQQAFTISPAAVETEWEKFALSGSGNNSQHFDIDTAGRCPRDINDVSDSFIMDPRTATAITTGPWLQDIDGAGAPPYAQTQLGASVTSYGMWIERTYHAGSTGSYDFNVRACWYGAGQTVPMQLETTVRLYAPAA